MVGVVDQATQIFFNFLCFSCSLCEGCVNLVSRLDGDGVLLCFAGFE